MQAFRFSQVLASEGFHFDETACDYFLRKFHEYDPDIQGVFQDYVIRELTDNRQLTTPFGRVRQFFALRDYADNKKVFKEGFAQIPQSTVGDNTGMSILWLENNFPGAVVMDGHDAVYLEVPESDSSVQRALRALRESFARKIRFKNGFELEIPIEYEVGYSLGTMKALKECDYSSEAGLLSTLNSLKEPASHL
jgi:hypothetical protein